jgi:hypothetical protein
MKIKNISSNAWDIPSLAGAGSLRSTAAEMLTFAPTPGGAETGPGIVFHGRRPSHEPSV